MIIIKELTENDIYSEMLNDFNHYQVINNKWVNNRGKWELTPSYDLREWNKEKRIWITEYLQLQIERGGYLVAAFVEDILVGFCCVDGYLAGNTSKYANLTMLFIDDRFQKRGIGKKLFESICTYARKMNADKLFISAIPSFETVSFYLSMGCKDANEIIFEYVDTDEDRYLEYSL